MAYFFRPTNGINIHAFAATSDSQYFVGAKTTHTHKRHASMIKFGLAFGPSWHELLLSGAASQMYDARHESSVHMRHFT